ncbi:hypothetical protein M569_13596, partial [Genlisea aurea]
RRQNKKEDAIWHQRSIFEVLPGFFDSCSVIPSPFFPGSLHDVASDSAADESAAPNKATEHQNSDAEAKTMQRWSCNTCNIEFESLRDQRLHFKCDLHRLNIKLRIAGKNIIKEDEVDESTSDFLYNDYEISSISGSECEEENQLLPYGKRGLGQTSKSKIYIRLKNKELISIYRCFLLDDFESILFENDKSFAMDQPGVSHLAPSDAIEKLNRILREPRDGTQLRIVLLAQGGHFAGCIFDGDFLVTHKTFHRYVVRAKAGKKQSSKDAGGRSIHSAGASLRRYNELALKKDVRELLSSWMRYFAVAACVFIHAPSTNRQLLFDGEKPCFVYRRAVRHIPLPVRRPTFKEAKRLYGLLKQISPENTVETPSEEIPLLENERPGHAAEHVNRNCEEICETEVEDHLKVTEDESVSSMSTGMAGLSLSEDKIESVHSSSTPLHRAAKSGNAQKVLELLEQDLDPCIKDERGRTPYMLAADKEVRNIFRRFMASNLEKWDWHAAKVPSALTKEMEESQAAKQAEKDAKRKARAKELKKLKKAKEKAQVYNLTLVSPLSSLRFLFRFLVFYVPNLIMIRSLEREKRAEAAERRIAAAAAEPQRGCSGCDGIRCSLCDGSLAGKVPFHRYDYKYCSSSCMHAHREILERG